MFPVEKGLGGGGGGVCTASQTFIISVLDSDMAPNAGGGD